MIKSVIFDMDGLLIDSEPLWREAQKLVFTTVGISLTQSDAEQTMGLRIEDVVNHWYTERPWEGTPPKEIQDQILAKVLELIESTGTAMPGVHTTLALLASHDIKMAIASSSTDTLIAAVLKKLDIQKYFESTYSATHEAYGKPNPGVYLTAAENLQVPPQKCLVFEDSPTGVLAAKSARMHCIAIPEPENKSHPYIRIADHILESLNDFDKDKLQTYL